MNTPNVWTLNIRGLDWLEAEANRWFGIMAGATGQDKVDAKAYLSAVVAERNQRQASYQAGIISTAGAGLTGFFELFGGSSGAGAPGLAAGVTDTAAKAVDKATSAATTIATVAVVVLAVAGYVYFNSKRGK